MIMSYVVYKCDRCGKEVNDDYDFAHIKVRRNTKTSNPKIVTWGEPEIEFDLCEDCYKILVDVLNAVKPTPDIDQKVE